MDSIIGYEKIIALKRTLAKTLNTKVTKYTKEGVLTCIFPSRPLCLNQEFHARNKTATPAIASKVPAMACQLTFSLNTK